MGNNFEKVIDILIAIIIFFIFPLLYFSQRQETLIQQVVSNITENFVETVNTHGVLTKDMYRDLLSRLDGTNVICKVKLEHKKLALEPEYRLRTPDEVINEQNKAYSGTNIYHYHPVSTELPVVTDAIDNSGLVMNTDTNESIISKAVKTSANSSHVHDADCCAGHMHSIHSIVNHTHNSSCTSPGTYHSCGFVSGDNDYNCYAGKVKVSYDYYSGMDIFCDECGWLMYECYVDRGSLYSPPTIRFMDSNRKKPAVVFTGDAATEYIKQYDDLDKWIRNFPTTYDYSCGSYFYHIPRTCFGKIIPYYGQFKGCPICNDIRIETKYGDPILYCAKCGRALVRDRRAWGEGVQYYDQTKGNWFRISSISDAQAMDIINRIESFYSSYATSPKEPCNKMGVVSENQLKYFNNGMQVYVSSDAPVFNIPELKPYIFHGCPYNQGYTTYCNGIQKCNEIVVSIIPTNPVQTVYVGEALITTAKATYKDGSQGIVLCSADFTTTTPVKDKEVTLSFVNIENKTLTCKMKVTVIPKNKLCSNGHIYNLNSDGTDTGCPYCKAWLKSLVVFHPTGGTLTIYRGTTLQENGVELLATYLDGHKEYVTTGYADNLDKYYVGIQDVTLSYKGKKVNLLVTTKRNIVQCPKCKHWYELYPDDTNPGCPYCKARTPIFTGNVLKYYSETYSDEILKELYEGSGSYHFKSGDYFTVTISNKSETLGSKILGFVIHDIPKMSIHVEYGGTVHEDEDEDK